MSYCFAKNVKTLRKINGFTQQKLSENVGVSRTTVSAWENRITEPDLATLSKIKNLLNVTYEDLLDD